MDLFQTLYVPTCSRNLISVSRLDLDGFNWNIGNKSLSLFKNKSCIGSGILIDGLYKIKLDGLFAETLLTLHPKVGTKRSLTDESSSFLWHKRLGHICNAPNCTRKWYQSNVFYFQVLNNLKVRIPQNVLFAH